MPSTIRSVRKTSSTQLASFDMDTLKHKIIKNREQYNKYCEVLQQLVFDPNGSEESEDEIELLTLLIRKYDEETSRLKHLEPVPLLISLMEEHSLKAKNLADLLGVSKGLISDILNYKKGLSKEVIRKLSEHFKMKQEAFNRPYELKITSSPKMRDAKVMNTTKQMQEA